jgi:AsmA family protein
MTNWRKAAFWSAGALALVGLAAALAIHAIVDPERLKKVAREKALAAWNRDLAIGDVSLQFLPMPALHAEKVVLSNPPGSPIPRLLLAESITADLALLPLLLGKVRFKGLTLDGAKLNVEVTDSSAAAQKQAGRMPSMELFSLTTLNITNTDIDYRRKGQPVTRWRIEEATVEADPGLRDVRVDASIARNTFPLKIKARLADLSRYGVEGAVSEGTVHLDWGRTRLVAEGRFPLEANLRGHALEARLHSTSPGDMFAFLGVGRRPRAPLEVRLVSKESQGRIDISGIVATLGRLKVTGDVQLALGTKTIFEARLQGDRLDWAQTMLDAGGPVIPALESDELFHSEPLAWPLLAGLQGSQGKVEVKIASLRLRNGVELRNARANAAIDGDLMNVGAFSVELLGGSASGSMRFEGRRKGVRVNFNGDNLLLQRWFGERGRKIPFTGGPMKVKASFSSTGNSIKELAAGVTGPIAIRMGPGVWVSEKAGDAETMMVGALSGRQAKEIDFECVGAALPFLNGRAQADAIVGIRTRSSLLPTSGFVDLRDESVDLRGRVKPRSGTSGGFSVIVGDVKIAGMIRHPKMSLDPLGTPGAIARMGAALATAGISIVGTALADSASPKSDPCEVAFK